MRSTKRTLTLASLSFCFGISTLGSGCGGGGSDSEGDMNMDDMSMDDGGMEPTTTGKDDKTGSSTAEDTTDDSKGSSVKPKMGDLDCSSLKAEGVGKGDVGPDVKLTGADGEEYNLHDYCNSVVVAVMGSAH